jgi:hypothetical protein
METMVTAKQNGHTETYVGLTICEGPGTCRLILTRPYHQAGRIVEIPNSTVTAIETVESTPLGDDLTPTKAKQPGPNDRS